MLNCDRECDLRSLSVMHMVCYESTSGSKSKNQSAGDEALKETLEFKPHG